jgi:hypothetical protein
LAASRLLHRGASGFSILVAIGITYGLGGDMRGQCMVDCGQLFPQLRVAFGRWF